MTCTFSHNFVLTAGALLGLALLLVAVYFCGRLSRHRATPRFGRTPTPLDQGDLEQLIRNRQNVLRDVLDRKSR